MIILQHIQWHSLTTPSKTAVIEGEQEVCYRDLWETILRAATYFQTVGKKGDRVVLSGSKNIDFVYAYFGIQMAGMIAITIDPEINETRLNRIVTSATPIGIYGKLGCKAFETKEIPDFTQFEPLSEIVFPSESDISDILFTTGTTGLPKGVVLTHENTAAAATNINTFINNDKDSIELLALPISHSFGLGRMRCTMQLGATIDLLGSFASMKKFFRELDNRHCTGFGMVPASWNYISKMSGEKLAGYANQIKYIEIGSAFMPLAEKHKLLQMLPNTRICMHYGLTEASRSAFICFNESLDQLETIGVASPNTDIKIFDEQGNECPVHTDGEVCVKGKHVCSAYWGDDAEKYPESFYGEYFRTGDWGYIREDKRICLISRKKELINVGGKKVSPIEVEEVINDIPGVVESACVGTPDPVMGEVVKAFVVKNCELAAEDIQKFTMARLENYKVPAQVEFINEIPKTNSGKIQRLLLK